MAKDFFAVTRNSLCNLNQNERSLYEFVIKNMDTVKDISIQNFAKRQFVSTTTVFRFVQKLGFAGYTDFLNSLLITSYTNKDLSVSDVIVGGNYSETYLQNAIEAVRVMSPERVKNVLDVLQQNPGIYILCDDNTHTIGQYTEKLFIGLGFRAYFPEAAYQMQTLVNHIRKDDMIIALSYTGQDPTLIDVIERIYMKERPYLLSVTRADNNILESLSDTNFYVFADEMHLNEMDLTSVVPMLMVLELLVYQYVKILRK